MVNVELEQIAISPSYCLTSCSNKFIEILLGYLFPSSHLRPLNISNLFGLLRWTSNFLNKGIIAEIDDLELISPRGVP
jgi:hypothetical protein